VLGSPHLPNFFLKSDMFLRVRVRVNSTEVLAGGLVLPLGCNANVVFTGIANAVWLYVKLDSFKRSPKAHLVERVECLDGRKRYLFYCNMPVLPWDIEKLQQGFYVGRVYHPLNSHHQREDMHHPSLLGVVAQAVYQKLKCLLLSYGCR
jgi:hypothetical protein